MDLKDDVMVRQCLELKPGEASLRGIFRVLMCADIKECEDFIEIVKPKKAIAERRWTIFLSILVQKGLLSHKNLISSVGSAIEMCLNVAGNKHNLAMFSYNLFRGKVELPPKTSANYKSILGYLDSRVELDNNIEPGSIKYFASLSAMASKLAYENNNFIQPTVEKTWKMELVDHPYSFWDDRYKAATTQAFMFRDINVIIVAFRGTEPLNANDWITDLDISWYKLNGIKGRVHAGFMKALGLNQDRSWPKNIKTDECDRQHAYHTITEELKRQFEINQHTKFIVTGHSLGGALAVLFPAVLAMHNENEVLEKLEAVYTFGQPRVGDAKFGRFMEEKFKLYGVQYYRFVYNNDIVPRVPFDDSALMYKHFGTCLYVNSLYEAKVVKEEPHKNYFEHGLPSVVTREVDAVWEVVRSFLLPRMFGADYKEGLLQKMFRVVGLFCQGLPNHGPQDYVNSTRLATY